MGFREGDVITEVKVYERLRFKDATVLVLKMEKGTRSKGAVGSRSWKRQGDGLSPRASRRR